MRLLIILNISFLLLSQGVLSQKRERFPSYFGFQFKPLIPGDFLAKSQITVRDGNFSGIFTQKYGYSFGAMTRVGLTKLISLETGINQVKRNFSVAFNHADSSLTGNVNFGVVSYDIPLNAMIYIQLSEKVFTNASIGSSLVYYPSNVGTLTEVGNKIAFSAEGRRMHRFAAEINANFGFELRTKKDGFFYIGASAKVPLAPIYKVAATYQFASEETVVATGLVNGAYLSMDFRYFLPYSKSKEKEKIVPIIQ